MTPETRALEQFCDMFAEALGFANKLPREDGSTIYRPTEPKRWVGIVLDGNKATAHFGPSGEMRFDFERLPLMTDENVLLRARVSGSIPITVGYTLGTFDAMTAGLLVAALNTGREYEYAEAIDLVSCQLRTDSGPRYAATAG